MTDSDDMECISGKDASPRSGELAIENTSAVWQDKTVKGALELTDGERKKLNIETGSLFNIPVICLHHYKQNGGIMHIFQGHTTAFTEEVTAEIRDFEKDHPWRVGLNDFVEELDNFEEDVMDDVPELEKRELEEDKKRLTTTPGAVTQTKKKIDNLEKQDQLHEWEEQNLWYYHEQ